MAAKRAGYYATLCGRVFDKNHKEITGTPLKHSGHLRMTLYADGVNEVGYCSVLKHRFISYFFKGESIFSSPIIRHRNDVPDDNRICNITPGTHKENRADIPREKISIPARKYAHILVARSRKLNDQQIREMRQHHADTNESYAKIAHKFEVSTMTAYRVISRQSWKEIE